MARATTDSKRMAGTEARRYDRFDGQRPFRAYRPRFGGML